MWHEIYLSVKLTPQQKLDEQNPILLKQYISLYDQDVLLFLKKVEFLDPIHSIHFLIFKMSWRRFLDFSCVGMPCHIEVFLKFFLDPNRSGRYHLTPQHHADIVAWMIQYYHPLPMDIFVRQFQSRDGKANMQMPWVGFPSNPFTENIVNQTIYIPIDVHLSRAALFAEQLIETIRSYTPHTFPLMAHSEVCGIPVVIQHYSSLIFKSHCSLIDLELHPNGNWSCMKNTGKR